LIDDDHFKSGIFTPIEKRNLFTFKSGLAAAAAAGWPVR
jgi:hypothetical protein